MFIVNWALESHFVLNIIIYYHYFCIQLDVPTVLTTISRFHLKFLQVHHSFNESIQFTASLKIIEIPFYISDGFLYFNASKANEIGMKNVYHVVVAANGTAPGMVGMVLTTVYIERGECSLLCM